jgi:probable addiction module antidote protein
VSAGTLGDVKPVGEGVNELRLAFGAGYRIYFGSVVDELIILLCRGEKVRRIKILKRPKNFGLITGAKTMNEKTSRSYDEWVIESLKGDKKAQAEYVQTTIEDNQGFPKAILVALRHVAEARAFKHFAEETNLNRETLYKNLSEDGNPISESHTKMLDISVKPKKAS